MCFVLLAAFPRRKVFGMTSSLATFFAAQEEKSTVKWKTIYKLQANIGRTKVFFDASINDSCCDRGIMPYFSDRNIFFFTQSFLAFECIAKNVASILALHLIFSPKTKLTVFFLYY